MTATAETLTLAERLAAAQADGLDANARRFLRFRASGARAAYPIELQALGIPSGRFEESRFAHARAEDEAVRLANAADRFGGFGVFALANGINSAVATREKAGEWHPAKKGSSTTDADIAARLLLFVDVDAKRPRGTSASEEELALTFPVAEHVAAHFPVGSVGFGHSGNGASVFVALDSLAETSTLAELVRGILGKLGQLYSRGGVEIDGSVCDAKRLCPAFGTVKRKGAVGQAERPHRRTAFLGPEEPRRLSMSDLEIVDAGLTELCPPAPRTTRGVTPQGGESPYDRANRVDVRLVLSWLGLLDGDQPTCPGCRESDGSAVSVVGNALKCLHARCSSLGHPRHPGFRTPVDLVAEAHSVSPGEAVREIADHFGFAGPARPTAAPTRPVEHPADVPDCYDPGESTQAAQGGDDEERAAIQSQNAPALDSSDPRAWTERKLAQALAKRDWTAAAKHAQALASREPAETRMPIPAAERARAMAGRSVVRMPTGWPTFDGATRGGIPQGRRVFIVGQPGVGKTGIVVEMAVKALTTAGMVVGLLAADEEADGLLVRLGQVMGLARDELDDGHASACYKLAQVFDAFPDIILADADEDEATVDSMAAQVAQHAKTVGKPGLLIVDSIQTARAEGSDAAADSGPRARVDCVIAALKRASKAHGLTVIATSEAARGWYRGGKDKTSALSAAKESGAIEYQAHALLAVSEVDGEVGVSQVEVAKVRFGRRVSFRLRQDFARCSFCETDAPPQESDADRIEAQKERDAAALEQAKDEILKLLLHRREPVMSRADLCAMTGVRRAIAEAAISELLRKEMISKRQRVGFRVVSSADVAQEEPDA